jgi:hypothetical protein
MQAVNEADILRSQWRRHEQTVAQLSELFVTNRVLSVIALSLLKSHSLRDGKSKARLLKRASLAKSRRSAATAASSNGRPFLHSVFS